MQMCALLLGVVTHGVLLWNLQQTPVPSLSCATNPLRAAGFARIFEKGLNPLVVPEPLAMLLGVFLTRSLALCLGLGVCPSPNCQRSVLGVRQSLWSFPVRAS